MPQRTLQWISSLIGAGSCWWMAFAVWRALHSGQGQVFGVPILYLYLAEFILVHAGSIPMIAASNESKSAKMTSLVLVSVIYAAFIAAIAVAAHSPQLLLTILGIMIPRWTGFFTDSENVRQQQIARSLKSTLAFVFTIIPIALLSNNSNPFGPGLVAYFTLMGLFEGTAPLRRTALDKSQRTGCLIAILTFTTVIVIIGKMFIEAIWSAFHQ
jgi:hypothetical protein